MTGEAPIKRKKAAEKPHYVNNKEFSAAVRDYVASAPKGERDTIPEYIGNCILKIARGLSCNTNFKDYSYRDEMICDGIENCIKAVGNYDHTKFTRTGNPNAFSYFTQICYWAFVRRIQLEKKQMETKLRYMESAGIDNFAEFGDDAGHMMGNSVVERVRSRADTFFKDDLERLPKVSRKRVARAPKESTSNSLF